MTEYSKNSVAILDLPKVMAMTTAEFFSLERMRAFAGGAGARVSNALIKHFHEFEDQSGQSGIETVTDFIEQMTKSELLRINNFSKGSYEVLLRYLRNSGLHFGT